MTRRLMFFLIGLMVLSVGGASCMILSNTNSISGYWKEAADTLGITYGGTEEFGTPHAYMWGTIDGMQVTMKLDGRGGGSSYHSWTQARVEAGLTDQVFLDSGGDRDFFIQLRNTLAEQVTVGDPRFDETFQVEGDPNHVRRLFDDGGRKALLDATDFARVRVMQGAVIVEHRDRVKSSKKLVKTMRLAVELAKTLKLTEAR